MEYIEFRVTFLYLNSIATPQFENRLEFRYQLPLCYVRLHIEANT